MADTPEKNSAASTVNGDDASSSSEFPTLEMLTSVKKPQPAKGRSSMSSVTTSRDDNDSSGYSTPLTSAVATPIPPPEDAAPTGPSKGGRGRRSTKMATSSGVSMVAQAAALRNSQYSLKRKHVPDSEEEDADDDNSPDAQLARALQEKEDAAAPAMDIEAFPSTSKTSGCRTSRTNKKLRLMADYASEDEDEVIMAPFSPNLTKRPKIVLSSKDSNNVSFTSSKSSKKTKAIILDSEDTEDFDDTEELDESDDYSGDFKPPTLNSTSRKKQAAKSSVPRRVGSISARKSQKASTAVAAPIATPSSDLTPAPTDSEFEGLGPLSGMDLDESSDDASGSAPGGPATTGRSAAAARRINLLEHQSDRAGRRGRLERARLESHHPVLHTMWKDLEQLPKIGDVKIEQPKNINRELKPFQLSGVGWMQAMEKTSWGGGLLGDEMGMGKTIQAVSLIMSDFPAKLPSLVLIPPVALMQWQQEIESYTDGTLKTFVYHGTNAKTKGITKKELVKYDVILMSYNSLESMYRKQQKGTMRKGTLHKQASVIHSITFHRVILDEAHNIKVSTYSSDGNIYANHNLF